MPSENPLAPAAERAQAILSLVAIYTGVPAKVLLADLVVEKYGNLTVNELASLNGATVGEYAQAEPQSLKEVADEIRNDRKGNRRHHIPVSELTVSQRRQVAVAKRLVRIGERYQHKDGRIVQVMDTSDNFRANVALVKAGPRSPNSKVGRRSRIRYDVLHSTSYSNVRKPS